MSDSVSRLNAALEGRYAIERELGEGGDSASEALFRQLWAHSHGFDPVSSPELSSDYRFCSAHFLQ